MANKIAASLAAKGNHFTNAGTDLHHLQMGPGADLEKEWLDAGLTLPDLPAMRQYRLDRIVRQLQLMDFPQPPSLVSSHAVPFTLAMSMALDDADGTSLDGQDLFMSVIARRLKEALRRSSLLLKQSH